MAARPRVPPGPWGSSVEASQVYFDNYPELPRRGGSGSGAGQLAQHGQGGQVAVEPKASGGSLEEGGASSSDDLGQYQRIVHDIRALWGDSSSEEEGGGWGHDDHSGPSRTRQGHGEAGRSPGAPDHPSQVSPRYCAAFHNPGQASTAGGQGRGEGHATNHQRTAGLVPNGVLLWHVFVWDTANNRSYPRATRRGHFPRFQVPAGPVPGEGLEHIWTGHNGAGSHDRRWMVA